MVFSYNFTVLQMPMASHFPNAHTHSYANGCKALPKPIGSIQGSVSWIVMDSSAC